MSELPHKLSQGVHPVTYRTRRGDARTELKEAIERKYVHVFFTETRGGTELGFPLDETLSNVSEADWQRGEGSVRLVGALKLDGVPVRCVVDLDVGTVEGNGRLEILSA
ncbi:MAG: MbtH domain protein [Gemmatimonadetes bacterium]|nr:MbtH domain protein [Gemmatimonadota bacterium]